MADVSDAVDKLNRCRWLETGEFRADADSIGILIVDVDWRFHWFRCWNIFSSVNECWASIWLMWLLFIEHMKWAADTNNSKWIAIKVRATNKRNEHKNTFRFSFVFSILFCACTKEWTQITMKTSFEWQKDFLDLELCFCCFAFGCNTLCSTIVFRENGKKTLALA